jgi:two-component system nitrate/nitrite response regulator NarL
LRGDATAFAYGVAVPDPRIRVAAVDDHPVLLLGVMAATVATGEISFAGTAGTVDELLADRPAADVVLLDLLLRDSSRPRDNVQALIAAGYAVLLFTEGDRLAWIADAMRAGARGVVTKAQSPAKLLEGIKAVHAGDAVLTPEMAAALHRDSALRPRLTRREEEALRLVSRGLADKQAARAMDISEDTLKEYIKRVRAKYAESGRPAASRVELNHRAVEDGYVRDDWPDSGR